MPGYGISDDIAAYIQENEQLKAENGQLRQENERLKKALTEASRLTIPDRLDTEIALQEEKLQDLYLKRRGKMIDDYYGWCSVCGRERVAVADGCDTCYGCLKG
jgi:RNA polymerase-binding transcription factor DksA